MSNISRALRMLLLSIDNKDIAFLVLHMFEDHFFPVFFAPSLWMIYLSLNPSPKGGTFNF